MNSLIEDFSPTGDFTRLINSLIIEYSNIECVTYINRKVNTLAHNLIYVGEMLLAHQLWFQDLPHQLPPFVICNVWCMLISIYFSEFSQKKRHFIDSLCILLDKFFFSFFLYLSFKSCTHVNDLYFICILFYSYLYMNAIFSKRVFFFRRSKLKFIGFFSETNSNSWYIVLLLIIYVLRLLMRLWVIPLWNFLIGKCIRDDTLNFV